MSARDLTAAGIFDPALRVGYERCRRLNAIHGKSYYLATHLLPKAKRPFVHALYGFARFADDIVDGIDPALPAAERANRFRTWSNSVRSDLEWGTSDDPICRALLDTLRRWDIPIAYVLEFLDSMAMDLTVTSYATYDELAHYMRGSAAVIGLQMLPILGRADDQVEMVELEPHAIDLGFAFQLTNFIRDIREDLDRGRVYLPEDSLHRFDVDRERLASGVMDTAIRELVGFEVARARGFYVKAEAGVALVHPTSQPCLRAAITLYSGILDEIEDADCDVFSRRATVSLGRRALIGGRGLVCAWSARRSTGRRPSSEPDPGRERHQDHAKAE
jgi:phytoene synthase